MRHLHGNVFAHRSGEQEILLEDYADLATEPCRVGLGDIDAIYQNSPALGDVKPLQQFTVSVLLPEPLRPTRPLSSLFAEYQTETLQDFRTVGPGRRNRTDSIRSFRPGWAAWTLAGD